MSDQHTRLVQLGKELKAHFAGHLKSVVIFGSQARGEASEESDYDCLLVFDQVTPEIKAALERIAGDYLVQQGLVLSCIPLGQGDLGRLRFEPFFINASREGVTV